MRCDARAIAAGSCAEVDVTQIRPMRVDVDLRLVERSHVKCAWQGRPALRTCAALTNGTNVQKATNEVTSHANHASNKTYPQFVGTFRVIHRKRLSKAINVKIVLNVKKRPGIGLIRIILK